MTGHPNNRTSGRAVSQAKPLVKRACTTLSVTFALAAVGCGGDATGSSTKQADLPVVVATTNIWADVVDNVICDGSAEVVSLVAPGADPHADEPSMGDRAAMSEASLVVANGLGLESGLEAPLVAAQGEGVVVFRFGDAIDTIHSGDGNNDEGADNGAGPDPHVWQDPTRVLGALPALVDALVDEVGLDAEVIQSCADDYADELRAVDEEVEATLGEVDPRHRKLVTSHDSFAYFADRYDWEVIGSVIPSSSTLAETSPAQLEALAEAIENAGVSAVFAETQHSSEDSEALARRVGDVEVVTLWTGSLGGPGSGAQTYASMLTSNAELIANALK